MRLVLSLVLALLAGASIVSSQNNKRTECD